MTLINRMMERGRAVVRSGWAPDLSELKAPGSDAASSVASQRAVGEIKSTRLACRHMMSVERAGF